MAKSIAGEVAAGAQDVVDQADALEELRPVDVGDQAHAGDDVAHGDVGRALALMLARAPLVGRRALARQPLFEPARAAGVTSRVLVAQPLDELDDEAVGRRRPS